MSYNLRVLIELKCELADLLTKVCNIIKKKQNTTLCTGGLNPGIYRPVLLLVNWWEALSKLELQRILKSLWIGAFQKPFGIVSHYRLNLVAMGP